MSKIDVYRLRRGKQISLDWIRRVGEIVVGGENWKIAGSLSIIIVDNTKIQDLNSRFLRRNRPTDVIAFPLGEEGGDVWGEVYVSEEQAAKQASVYRVSFEEELARLVIHGILHLLGYDDGDVSQREKMREREDHYLAQAIQNKCKE